MTKCPSAVSQSSKAAPPLPTLAKTSSSAETNPTSNAAQSNRFDRFDRLSSYFFSKTINQVGHPLFPALPTISPTTNYLEDRVRPTLKKPVAAPPKEMDGFDFLIEQILPRVEEGSIHIAHFSVNDGGSHPRYSGLAVPGEARPTRHINFVKANTESYLDAEFKKVRGVSRLVSFRLLFDKPLTYEIEPSPGKYRKFPVYGVRLVRSPDGIVRADPILVAKKIKNPCLTPPKPDPALPLGESAVIAYTLKPETEALPEGFPQIDQSLKDKIVAGVLEERGYASGLLFLLELFAYEWGIDCKVFEENGAPCHALATDLPSLFKILRYILDPEYADRLDPKTYDPNHSYEDKNGKVQKIPKDPKEVAKINEELAANKQIKCETSEKGEVCNRGTYAAPTQKTKGEASVVISGGKLELPYKLGTLFLEGSTRVTVNYDPKGPSGKKVTLKLESLTEGKEIKITRNDLKIEGYHLLGDQVRSPTVEINFDTMVYEPEKKSKELPPFSLSFKNPEVKNFSIKDPAQGNLFVSQGRLDSISMEHRYQHEDKKHVVNFKVQGLKSSGYARSHGTTEDKIPFAVSMAGSSKLDLDSEITWIEGEERIIASNNLHIAGEVNVLKVTNTRSAEELRFKAQKPDGAVNPIQGDIKTVTIFSRQSGEILTYDYEAHLDFNNVNIELDSVIPISINNIEAKTKVQSATAKSLHVDIVANSEELTVSTQEGKSTIETNLSSDLKIISKNRKTTESTTDAKVILDFHKAVFSHEKGLVEFDAGIHIDIGRQINLKEFLKVALKPVLLLSNQKPSGKTLPSIQEVTADLPEEQKQKFTGHFLRIGRLHYTRNDQIEKLEVEEALGSLTYGQSVSHQTLLPPYEFILFRLPKFTWKPGKQPQLSWPSYANILLGGDGLRSWP